ncbi:Sua5/YciO/YrdC/YwlC family protein [Streptomyces sp. NPDC005385]|uniref:Sua5/YciO/YrdC/YwlC family protein n=1 Tax=Streptomyces sp. NPDC005385 TaxID=3157039 RepID=UPI0033B1B02A
MRAEATPAPWKGTDLRQAMRALREGAAVVLPNPAPLTHVVAATIPQAVNEAKGRPSDQPTALWAHHPDTLHAVAAITELDTAGTALAGRLLSEEHLTLLVPLRPSPQPSWLAPACKAGWALLFGARWQPLRPLLDEHPVLYVSSANRTGRQPAATAADALAMFPATVPVLQLPNHPESGTSTAARQATTTVALHPDGRLTLHRHGAQDRDYDHSDDYLHHLRARYACTSAGATDISGGETHRP